MNNPADIKAFIELSEKADQLLVAARHEELRGADPWPTVYARVFEDKNSIRKQQVRTGIRIEWYDPDTSYEDDCRAYLNELRFQAGALRNLKPELHGYVQGNPLSKYRDILQEVLNLCEKVQDISNHEVNPFAAFEEVQDLVETYLEMIGVSVSTKGCTRPRGEKEECIHARNFLYQLDLLVQE